MRNQGLEAKINLEAQSSNIIFTTDQSSLKSQWKNHESIIHSKTGSQTQDCDLFIIYHVLFIDFIMITLHKCFSPFLPNELFPSISCLSCCCSTLRPDTSRRSRQRTRIVTRTANPMFNHTMVYDGLRPEDLREVCIELTVWDHGRLDNHYIGGLRLGLGTGESLLHCQTIKYKCELCKLFSTWHWTWPSLLNPVQSQYLTW